MFSVLKHVPYYHKSWPPTFSDLPTPLSGCAADGWALGMRVCRDGWVGMWVYRDGRVGMRVYRADGWAWGCAWSPAICHTIPFHRFLIFLLDLITSSQSTSLYRLLFRNLYVKIFSSKYRIVQFQRFYSCASQKIQLISFYFLPKFTRYITSFIIYSHF